MDTEPIVLGQGINVITGQNNVGKTAILEALSLKLLGHPHRSIATVPLYSIATPSSPWADFTITASNADVKDILANSPGDYQICMPKTPWNNAGLQIYDFNKSNVQLLERMDFKQRQL